jgi:hypothetical protein
MKKITAILVIFIFVGTALSAEIKFGEIKPSAGFMVLGDASLGNGKITKNAASRRSQQLQNINGGVGLFVDITYAEIYAGATYGLLNYVNKPASITSKGIVPGPVTRDIRGTGLQFGFSILGKYPIEIGSITFFPLLGFNYNTFMYAWDKRGEPIDDPVKTFTQYGIQAGAGFDYDITSRIYFRLEGLLQIRFVNQNIFEKFNMRGIENSGKVNLFPGIGPVIKAGVGFRIK